MKGSAEKIINIWGNFTPKLRHDLASLKHSDSREVSPLTELFELRVTRLNLRVYCAKKEPGVLPRPAD